MYRKTSHAFAIVFGQLALWSNIYFTSIRHYYNSKGSWSYRPKATKEEKYTNNFCQSVQKMATGRKKRVKKGYQ